MMRKAWQRVHEAAGHTTAARSRERLKLMLSLHVQRCVSQVTLSYQVKDQDSSLKSRSMVT